MKKQTIKSVHALMAIMFPVFTVVFYTSCQKEKSGEILKINTAPKSSIIYIDVVPDSTLYGPHPGIANLYSLDLNRDGIADFGISVFWNYRRCGFECGTFNRITYVKAGCFNLNEITSDKNNFPLALNDSEIVDGSHAQWAAGGALRDTSFCQLCSSTSFGNWIGHTNKYLGLKLIASGNTYYGWVRLSVSVSLGMGLVTIKDYAYNSNSNQPILAGQTK